MALSLKLLTYKGEPLSEPKLVTFQSGDGTIGRSDDNTLVLPDRDKFVSRHHASTHYENGFYYLTDSSLGGVFIDNDPDPLHNASTQLSNGMRLRIGEYEIEVIIDEETSQDDFPFPDFFADSSSQAAEAEPLFRPASESEFNPLMGNIDSPFPQHEELIDAQKNDTPEFESRLQDHASPLLDSFVAPQIETTPPSDEEIPENLTFEDLFADFDAPPANRSIPDDSIVEEVELPVEELVSTAPSDKAEQPIVSSFSAPDEKIDTPGPSDLDSILNGESDSFKEASVAQPIQPSQPAQPITDNKLFDAFLQGAGIDRNECATNNPMEAMQRIGKMFRQFVAGTVSVLRSRAEFKSLFRVNVTVIRATDNNPLKFAVSTDDVLKQLIQNKEGGFLESVESIEQGFNDIMNHQLAMQAGIQASLNDLLKRFDPKTIEKQFEQGIVLQKKAKCWDSYQETYRIESEEIVENFFGDAFVEAYEEQMKVLTAARNKK